MKRFTVIAAICMACTVFVTAGRHAMAYYYPVPCEFTLNGAVMIDWLTTWEELSINVDRKCGTPSASRPGCPWLVDLHIIHDGTAYAHYCASYTDLCGVNSDKTISYSLLGAPPGHYWAIADVYKGRCDDFVHATLMGGDDVEFTIW
jgi:hypothetical protein